jgi:hypothetical protein
MRVFWDTEPPHYLDRQSQTALDGKTKLKDVAVGHSVLNFVTADERKADPFHKTGYVDRDDRNCQITKKQ